MTPTSDLGYCKTCSNPQKIMKLGMLVGIGNRKKIKVVAKMTYTYEGHRSRSKSKIRSSLKLVQNMSCLVSNERVLQVQYN